MFMESEEPPAFGVASRQNTKGLLSAFHASPRRLQTLAPHELDRPSLMKSNLGNLTKLNILPQDQNFILQLFQQSVLHVNSDVDMKILTSLSKFGQKAEGELNIRSVVDPAGVRDISYHAGCPISPVDPTVDVFWSRFGVQEVVGRRGSLFSVYSLSEAANFQSSMDHHELDIDPVL
ncbi:hypothetical protein Q8A67_007292 [Cirrhinus molitorella]|uniref:Uncharacterized protein n=1 Tax=Cirrhinus molitorella TaxID=172907 RepID=A0AA88PYW8_9TELE|nr:hypothetical protein Q8A67_007292 [Cirrhinus molitorella]